MACAARTKAPRRSSPVLLRHSADQGEWHTFESRKSRRQSGSVGWSSPGHGRTVRKSYGILRVRGPARFTSEIPQLPLPNPTRPTLGRRRRVYDRLFFYLSGRIGGRVPKNGALVNLAGCAGSSLAARPWEDICPLASFQLLFAGRDLLFATFHRKLRRAHHHPLVPHLFLFGLEQSPRAR